MNFGRIISIVLAVVAVLGVFVEIPIVSDYAFWVLVIALLTWYLVHPLTDKAFKPGNMMSIVLLTIAIVGVFVEIPIVSDYAFWVVLAAYFVVASVTK